jgi:hypothetical protein
MRESRAVAKRRRHRLSDFLLLCRDSDPLDRQASEVCENLGK